MTELSQYEPFATDLFSVRDTIGVPHTYIIGSKHITESSGMCLDIQEAESKGAHCMQRGCQLTYAEHETALALNCKSKDDDLLHAYLLSIKEQCEKDNFAGFVLVDCT